MRLIKIISIKNFEEKEREERERLTL